MSEQRATQLGHVGLFLTDLPKMVDFYTRVLGFVVTDAGEDGNPTFMSHSPRDHHQLVVRSGRPEGVKEMVQQVSFKLGTLAEVQDIYLRLLESEATDIAPVTHGIAWSVYFRDPEGNRIEMYTDTEWYVTQPFREPLDLEKPADVIYRETEAMCRVSPGFKPMSQWRAEFGKDFADKLVAAQ